MYSTEINLNKETAATTRATANRHNILELLKVAKLVKVRFSRKDNDPVYLKYEPNKETDTKMLYREAKALYLPMYNKMGYLLDYSDWHNVEVLQVLEHKGTYQRKKSVCFDVDGDSGTIWFNGNFHLPFIKEDFLYKRLELQVAELLFIGATIHSLLFIKEFRRLDSSAVLIDSDLTLIWEKLVNSWEEPESGIEECFIKSDDEDFYGMDMSCITLATPLKDRTKLTDIRLIEGPGFLTGIRLHEESGEYRSFRVGFKPITFEDLRNWNP